MSKKILKRSLALGALMAFVITGSAMAADSNNIVLQSIEATTHAAFGDISGLGKLQGNGYCNFFPKYKNESPNILSTNGDIVYSSDEAYGGHFGLIAGLSSGDKSLDANQKLASPNGNTLDIKHNIKVSKGSIYLYGGTVMSGADERYLDTAKDNSVYVGTEEKQITLKAGSHIFIGGALGNPSSTTFNALGNKVIVENVNFELPNSSYVCVYGGESRSGSAEGNTVVIKDTNITNANIFGGFVFNKGGEASNNTLTLVNVTIGENSECAGGYVYEVDGNADNSTINIEGNSQVAGTLYGGFSSKNSASNNTIVLKDNADVSDAKVYGNNGGDGTGNKLELDESYAGDGVVNTVGRFDEIVIENAEYGEAALKVTNMEYKNDDGSVNGGTKITVKKMTMSGNQELEEGTALNVIEATTKTGEISSESTAKIYKGTSQIIDVNFGGNNSAVSEITKTVRNDQVLVIGESRAAATAFVNQGSEIVETGLDALARDNTKAGDTKTFAAIYGNASEYATGSHVKVNGWSGIVGVGKTSVNGLTVGAFFENGEGNYRTYNTVNNDFMRGDGEACYNGGGILVRKDNANGVYTEASLRAGNLQNELRNAVRGSEGLAGYDIDTFYYGAHIGIGKVIPRGNEGDSIDVYGKFIYTHHDSESFNIDGDNFHFDSVDSERLRLGFRINEVQTNKLGMYYGAAWEYEFGGDADNTVVGYDLSTPSLGGSTVIGEVGMHYKASDKWSFDLNGRAYVGQREGFSGSVQANYAF